jgi:GntR family transcriptional regulator, arabinose operon transcriptional repressor
MANSGTSTPRIVELSEKIIADIQKRRLKPGDRYLTTSDVSKMLGVGNGLANRALQLLERRQVIIRQQRRGAFIAQLPGKNATPTLRRVHFLVHQNYLATEGIGNDRELLGIQSELPGVHVQISFLPKDSPEVFVDNLINQSLTSKSKDGFILVRAPYEVHRLVHNTGIPSVVYGGLYPGPNKIPRLDRDMDAVGYLSADYLLQNGHRRLAFLSRQQCLPGDNLTLDAIRRRLSKERLAPDALIERFLPSYSEVWEAEIKSLVSRKNPPTGFICRNLRAAEATSHVLRRKSSKLKPAGEIVLCDYYLESGQNPAFVYPRPTCSSEEIGKHMARMLAALADGKKVADEIISVEIDATASLRRKKQ